MPADAPTADLRDRAFTGGALVGLLWCAGLAAMVAVTGGDAWPLALAWAAAGVGLALLWRSLAGRRRARPALCGLLALVLVALTWEGGLFLLPAVLVAAVVSVRA
jgi:hypothetical protein